ncbi:hypothetical protein BM221_005642 [Beauveria bassiana]|uniref:Uncharacterized protein n=1 Tax=Beauveria bassiana TaxID=176275 RepID=A0A2N6NP76_BEABA|nr:hypothetical protein BM221_005642 [Beauveria bassiana]
MDTSHLETMRTIIPTIAGPKTQDEVSGKRFEIEPIGHIAFVQPVPDIFDCARRSELNEDICRTLRRRIIPAYRIRHPKNSDLAVPNWFVEARSLSDNTEACKRQISFEGAYGARAMHELQNYDRETGEKVCDGNAYTYSAVYVRESRCLEIFAHHMAKAAANGREQYFMTKLCEFNMTESKDSFQKGINAFRNARALAGKYRDAVIKIANNRAVMEQGRSKRRTYNMLAEVSRKEELSRLEELSRKEELSSKAEPSSLPKAALRKEGVLKRTRPDDDAVEGHEEAPSPKKVKRSQSII